MSPDPIEKLYPYPHERKKLSEVPLTSTKYDPPKLTIKDFTKRSCSNCSNLKADRNKCIECKLNPKLQINWKPVDRHKIVLEFTTSYPMKIVSDLGIIMEQHMSHLCPIDIRTVTLDRPCGGCGKELTGNWLFFAKDGKFWCEDCFYKQYRKKLVEKEPKPVKYCGTCVKSPCDHDYNECRSGGYKFWGIVEEKPDDQTLFEIKETIPVLKEEKEPEKECKDCKNLPPDGFCNVIGCYNYDCWIKKEEEIFVCQKHEICANKYSCPKFPCKDYSHFVERTCKNCGWGDMGNCSNDDIDVCKNHGEWKPIQITPEKCCDNCGRNPFCAEEPCNLYSNWTSIIPKEHQLCGNCRFDKLDASDQPCDDCGDNDKWGPKEKEKFKKHCINCGNSRSNSPDKKPCSKAMDCSFDSQEYWVPIKKEEKEK